MQEITKSYTVYDIDELSISARENAINNVLSKYAYFLEDDANDINESMKAYSDYFNFIYEFNNSHGPGSPIFASIQTNLPSDVENLYGVRALKWIINNFDFKVLPKYAGHVIHCNGKKNYNYIGTVTALRRYEYNYLTGMWSDECVYKAYQDFIANIRGRCRDVWSVLDFLQDIADNAAQMYNNAVDNYYTDACAMEIINDNDILFTEDGEIFND